jgi:hypothetical protein
MYTNTVSILPGDPAWGTVDGTNGWQGWVLCCPNGANDPPFTLPAIFTGDWIKPTQPGAYMSWGSAIDFCIAQGAEDVCPFAVYCPDGGGVAPFGGRRTGRTGNDQWAPISGQGPNVWVQTGIWGGDPGNTCLGHHQIAGGVHGNPGEQHYLPPRPAGIETQLFSSMC